MRTIAKANWVLLGALTSAVGSACGPRLAQPRSAEAAVLERVEQRRELVQADAERGTGPELRALAQLANCDLVELSLSLHRRYKRVFTAPTVVPTADPLSIAPSAPSSERGEAPPVAGAPNDAEVAQRVLRELKTNRVLRCVDLETGPGSVWAAGRRYVYGGYPWSRPWAGFRRLGRY
jgi:hypothetical protein